MVTIASVRKHPVHPMLIPLPIGLWVFSLVCDIIMFRTGNIFWRDCALVTMAGGVIGGLVAALPGFLDVFTMYRSDVKKIGLLHMSINLVIVTSYVAGFLWRRAVPSGMESAQFILSVVAVLLLGISGWLGGEMVYVHGVAVEPADRHKL